LTRAALTPGQTLRKGGPPGCRDRRTLGFDPEPYLEGETLPVLTGPKNPGRHALDLTFPSAIAGQGRRGRPAADANSPKGPQSGPNVRSATS